MTTDRSRVLVLGLGGTIASMAAADGGGAAPALRISELVAALPVGVEVVVRDVRLVPGSHLSVGDVLTVAAQVADAARAGFRGVVVVQGTDTIEEVAFGLSLLVGDPITVVVTGAMRPASAPGADGPANLAAAITAAASPDCAGAGVLVVIGDEIHAGPLVRKASGWAPHAFRSWPGPLGAVIEGRARLVLRPARQPPTLRIPTDASPPRVATVTATMASGAWALQPFLLDPPDALVVAGFGGGHAPPSWIEPLTELATARPVLLCSRTGTGPILATTYAFTGSERDLLGRGLISAGRYDPVKAALAATLVLMSGGGADEIRAVLGD